ncbi:MAG: hypothetical protein QOK11_1530 [Pseudonocardiales bacterium]|nr:hypothetical protein [Pseudonocardiales bacterium]
MACRSYVVMRCSTVESTTAMALGELPEKAGAVLVDATLCLGEPAAEDASMLIMCGRDDAALDRIDPVLATVGKDTYRLGGVGAGQIGKMLNNYLLWNSVVANYGALRLGGRLGLDLEALRQSLMLSSGNNWALETWLRARPMPWAEKDMRIVMQHADLVDFSYSFWLVDHPRGLTLVDCDFHAPAAARKSIVFERTAVEALALLGIGPAEINAVVLTHLHFDHAGSLPDFPEATVYLQRGELDYFSGRLMRFPLCASGLDAEDLAAVRALQQGGRLVLLRGDTQVLPGVRTHHVGGHTPGTQLVSVTDGPGRVVLTADAAHL